MVIKKIKRETKKGITLTGNSKSQDPHSLMSSIPWGGLDRIISTRTAFSNNGLLKPMARLDTYDECKTNTPVVLE